MPIPLNLVKICEPTTNFEYDFHIPIDIIAFLIKNALMMEHVNM